MTGYFVNESTHTVLIYYFQAHGELKKKKKSIMRLISD